MEIDAVLDLMWIVICGIVELWNCAPMRIIN